MKKKVKEILAIVGVLTLIISSFVGCQNGSTQTSKNSGELITVRLNEVVRSVFYAPMYVAINEGFFEEEGIKIDLSTGQGADATIANTQHVST